MTSLSEPLQLVSRREAFRALHDRGFMHAAQTLRAEGRFDGLANLVPYAEINGLFATDLPGHQAQAQ